MIVGYQEGVNKIIVYCKDGKKFTRKLAVNGLNCYTNTYSYYNAQDGLLHILDMKYIDKIRLYKDNQFIKEI